MSFKTNQINGTTNQKQAKPYKIVNILDMEGKMEKNGSGVESTLGAYGPD